MNADIPDGQAVGTIVNDDSVYLLSLGDAFAFEGHGESASVDFTVTLNEASTDANHCRLLHVQRRMPRRMSISRPRLARLSSPPAKRRRPSACRSLATPKSSQMKRSTSCCKIRPAPRWTNDYALGTIGNDDSTPGNNAPIAADDAYELSEDSPLWVNSPGVLANDYDPDGGMPQAFLVSGPAHGTLFLNPGGSFTYTPDANYFGPDSFTYRATDPGGLSDVATVSLTVWGMDDPIELAAPGPQTTAEDTPLTFSAANGNAITMTDIESPRVLVALLVQDGILTLPSTAGLEFPYPESTNNSPSITFYADNPAEANAALDGLVFTPATDFNGTASLDVLVDRPQLDLLPAERLRHGADHRHAGERCSGGRRRLLRSERGPAAHGLRLRRAAQRLRR